MRRFYLYVLTALVAIVAWPLVTAAQEGEPEEDSVERALSKSDEGLKEVVFKDGSVMVDLEGRFQSVSVARINEKGEREQSCVTNKQALHAFMNFAAQTETEETADR